MAGLTNRTWYIQIVRLLWPALLLLAANLVISTFIGRFTFIGGVEALWKIPVRYLRLSLSLTAPLFLLPLLAALGVRLFTFGHWELVSTCRKFVDISFIKTVLIRPLQGIGFSFLLSAKLIGILQGYSLVAPGSAGVLPPNQFAYQRMLVSTAIAVIASLVLSLFWTMEDLGISQHNRKTGEVRMIGKYLGVILPVVFGFAGYLSLLHDVSAYLAAQYVLQIIMALYPPFLTLAVCHALYVQSKANIILARLTGGSYPDVDSLVIIAKGKTK